jgi:3-methylfumaryl-CoA hydratase
MTVSFDVEHLRKWIGKAEEATDLVTARAVRGMRTTLSLDSRECNVGDAAPLTMHWCYLLALVSGPASGPGVDGEHDFIPPVPLAQRMWAGGMTEFVEPLRVGDVVTRRSEIGGVEFKNGRSGSLCFVTVNHTYSTPRSVATRDTQNLVFRDPAPTPQARAAPPDASTRRARHSKMMHADSALLFRYSLLTHNGHRSHYDRPFATGVEGFPGLMVHGPLQAALLLEYAIQLRGATPPKYFSHRGVAMLFEGEFTVNAYPTSNGFELWTADAAGVTCMTAEASW